VKWSKGDISNGDQWSVEWPMGLRKIKEKRRSRKG
jgi:hypothetical protein